MQIKAKVDVSDISARIFQLERRSTMEWYDKGQLLQDLCKIRETIYMLSRTDEEINNHMSDYYNKIDILVDQLI